MGQRLRAGWSSMGKFARRAAPTSLGPMTLASRLKASLPIGRPKALEGLGFRLYDAITVEPLPPNGAAFRPPLSPKRDEMPPGGWPETSWARTAAGARGRERRADGARATAAWEGGGGCPPP